MSCNNNKDLKDKIKAALNKEDIYSMFNPKEQVVGNIIEEPIKIHSNPYEEKADFKGSWAFAMDFLSKADKNKVFEIKVKQQ